jgi:phosphatidylglycerophosphate synthase
MTNDSSNVSDPRSAVVPRWSQALYIAVTAALIAFFYGQPPKIWTCAVFLGAVLVVIVAQQWRWRHGGRPARTQSTPASRVTPIVMILVLITAAIVLNDTLPLGTALSFGAQFLSALTVLGVGTTLRAHFARPRSEQP